MLITSIEHDPEPGPSNHPEPSGPRTRSRTKALPTPFGDLEYRKFTPLQDLRTPGQPLYQPASPNKWIDLTAFLPYLGEDPETETDEDEDLQDILYCTSDRLDHEFAELRQNEHRLDEWLLKTLTMPISEAAEEIRRNGAAQGED